MNDLGWAVALRSRVLTVNDYGGDPDGLAELAQLLLSPGVEVAGVIGSRLREGDGWDGGPARDFAAIGDRTTPVANAGADAIVAVAMDDGSEWPSGVRHVWRRTRPARQRLADRAGHRSTADRLDGWQRASRPRR